MWMLFSLTSLVLLAVGFTRWRGRRHWRGKPREGFRIAVTMREFGNEPRDRAVRVRVGLKVRDVLDFECRAETLLDRVAVSLGLAQEIELGRPSIDRAVYIMTNDPAVATWMRLHRPVMERLRQAFDEQHPAPPKVRRIGMYRGLLWMEFHDPRYGLGDVDRAFAFAVETLRAIAEALPTTRPVNSIGDPGVWRAATVLGCSSALAVTALLVFVGTAGPGWPFELDEPVAKALDWKAGAGLFAALLGLALVLVGRSARLPMVLLEVCTVGLFGALACGHYGARGLNQLLDDSPPILHEAVVLEASRFWVRKARGGYKRAYRLTFEAAPGSPPLSLSGVPGRVRVPLEVWVRFDEGQRVVLVEREGAFGVRWLEDVRPAP